MISIIITALKEPNIGKAIEAILSQKIKEKYELIIACPDKETKNILKKYPKVKPFQDPGKGKSFALNLLFKKAKGKILIFTDGDVYLENNAINEILKPFEDEKVGIVTGRPVSIDNKNNMYGYWGHLLCDAGAHSIRQELYKKGDFVECSAYLMAMRAKIIEEIPLDVAEDAIIPYYFYKRGFKIAYAPEAKVYVKYPDNFNDWLKQKIRTAKAHETLFKYAPDFPRVKSFGNEALRGWNRALSYPKTPKEFIWTLALFFARLRLWIDVFADTKLKSKHYTDAWERVETAR